MVSINGQKCGTSEGSYLIKQTSMLFGKDKNDIKKNLKYRKK